MRAPEGVWDSLRLDLDQRGRGAPSPANVMYFLQGWPHPVNPTLYLIADPAAPPLEAHALCLQGPGRGGPQDLISHSCPGLPGATGPATSGLSLSPEAPGPRLDWEAARARDRLSFPNAPEAQVEKAAH